MTSNILQPAEATLLGVDGLPIMVKPKQDVIEFAINACDFVKANTVVIRVSPAATPAQKVEMRNRVRGYLKMRDLERMSTLLIDGDMQLETVDEAFMNQCGWYRNP